MFTRYQKRNQLRERCLVRQVTVALSSDETYRAEDEEMRKCETKILEYLESPDVPSIAPLSIDSLQRAERNDILSALVKLGGSAVVAKRLGLQPSTFIATVSNPSAFPPFNEQDNGVALTIGRDLETRLETAASNFMPSKTNDESDLSLSGSSVSRKRKRVLEAVPSAEELLKQREQSQNISSDVVPVRPDDETMTLTPSIRVGLLTLAATAALGFGRVSQQVFDSSIIHVCQGIAYGLLVAHISLAFYSASVLAPKLKRSSSLWFLKTLLGGPFALRILRKLPK